MTKANFTENDIIRYLNAWQSDGKHLDATYEDIAEWLMDDSMYTDEDSAFFDGWTQEDFISYAKAIREFREYED